MAVEEYGLARASEGPQRPWPPGRLPAQQWFRDDPRRIEEALASPPWLLTFLTLYGGIKDYRVGRYEEKYQRSVEGFQEFHYIFEDVQSDGVYERALALDDYQPSPKRWRINFPFIFDPDFFFRHSPIHAELMVRCERGEAPDGDDGLLRLLSSSVFHRSPHGSCVGPFRIRRRSKVCRQTPSSARSHPASVTPWRAIPFPPSKACSQVGARHWTTCLPKCLPSCWAISRRCRPRSGKA